MSNSYDKQYEIEENLFGAPYEKFEDFVKTHALKGGQALDLGCGQGRDALMLAAHGYTVTGVDASQVGITQLLTKAKTQNLAIDGVVADLYTYKPDITFDAVVLDSILHFGKASIKKELALLDRISSLININGYLFIFVHKSPQKKKILKRWFETQKNKFTLIQDDYIDYTYVEKQSGFRSSSPFYMLILQRHTAGELNDKV